MLLHLIFLHSCHDPISALKSLSADVPVSQKDIFHVSSMDMWYFCLAKNCKINNKITEFINIVKRKYKWEKETIITSKTVMSA